MSTRGGDRRLRAAALAIVVAAACTAAAAAERSKAARAAFQREHPCPATGASRGACPGYQVDHRVALCAGGLDEPANMQWLTVEQHQRKTKRDVSACRRAPRAASAASDN